MTKICITGTSRGLGAALTLRFRELGHKVVGGARTAPGDLSEKLRAGYHTINVTSTNSQDKWWEFVELTLGGLPNLVIANAALINDSAPLWEVPTEQFKTVMEANLLGVFLTFKQFLQRWHAASTKEPAVLVALSSGWGRSTSPEVAPYCMTKWGVEGMVKALAQELPRELSVVALNPGIINTEMLQNCFGSGAAHYETAEQWAQRAANEILALGKADNGYSASIS